ncbi:apolipoprotein M [Protopterus annectens]|uniref:apolipoprotein M n=1 Tax=Protopterus annectens TaxID=7888 RepID=UPI001CFC40ED|nr:apolipoprotein M [Protopterus annectens]
MLQKVWSCILYLYSLVNFWQCEPAQKLAVGHVNMQQYYGNWNFIAAAAGNKSALESFMLMDNTLYHLGQDNVPEKMLLLAGIRLVTDVCITKNWTYHFNNEMEELVLEDRPQLKTEVFLAKCSDCIILQETNFGETMYFKRSMLYARTQSLGQEYVDDFREKAKCMGMKEFFVLPWKKEYCDIQSAQQRYKQLSRGT